MMRIPLLDLQAQYRAIKPEIDRAIRTVLQRGQFILGPEGAALEHEVAAYCGVKHAVAVASGTDALELSLRALRIGPGDEVITTAFSFFATAEAIIAVGARPVFADVDPVSYNLDPEDAARRITRRTKALLPVHLSGHPCAMDRLMAIAKVHRLKVIEDCAQAIGARFRGQPVGGFGDAGCLSFYPTKNLGGYGDGGMVVTNNRVLAEQIRLLRTHGSRIPYHHLILGTNSRLDELQAAVLRVKLPHLDRWNDARRHLAHRYTALITQQGLSGVTPPSELPDSRHVYHLYSVRLRRRDRVRQALAKQGIASQVYYPKTLPAQPALAALRGRRASYPNADALCRDILSLPLYPELAEHAIDRVIAELARAIR